jgi:hypothetical protein
MASRLFVVLTSGIGVLSGEVGRCNGGFCEGGGFVRHFGSEGSLKDVYCKRRKENDEGLAVCRSV